MCNMIIAAAVIVGGFLVFRYFSLLYALGKIRKEMDEIREDLSRNHILHLPVPDRHLAQVLNSVNGILEGVRRERQEYEKREREFQRQIENISHDLRTPLTVILGYLKFAEDTRKGSAPDFGELEEMLGIIESKAETMKNLSDQFYEFSRLNGEGRELSLETVDISRLLREALAGNCLLLEQADLEVEADLPDHPVWVRGDETALERIFLNLLQNAGRYAGSFLKISLREGEKASVCFLNDTDDISEEDIRHMFDRFYMQDPSRSRGGTGLGLTLSRSLAEKMGGELRAYAPAPRTVCYEQEI